MVYRAKNVIGTLFVVCILFATSGIGFASPWMDDRPFGPSYVRTGPFGLGPVGFPPRDQEPPALAKQAEKALPKLVKKKTITQDQADQIIAFFKEKDEQQKIETEKIKNMNRYERDRYFKDHQKERPDIIKDLMETVGLTKKQAKAVKGVLNFPMPPKESSQFQLEMGFGYPMSPEFGSPFYYGHRRYLGR